MVTRTVKTLNLALIAPVGIFLILIRGIVRHNPGAKKNIGDTFDVLISWSCVRSIIMNCRYLLKEINNFFII